MKTQPVFACLFIGLLLAGCATQAGSPISGPAQSVLAGSPPTRPVVGDTAVYRIRNGYSGEAHGEIQYRVEKIDGDKVVMSVTTSTPSAGLPHLEIYTTDGNWLRHPIVSHDRPVDYDFAPPYPAYAFPLDFGKSWSVRVNATNLATGKRNSVRVDGEVLGGERVSTPAGAFDTIKVKRRVYAGDWDGFLYETNLTEVDWYAPALGRAVRTERNSGWLDKSRSPGGGSLLGRNDQMMYGDWSVYELVSHTRN